MSVNTYRDFDKFILAVKLHQELEEWSEKFLGIQSTPDGTNKFRVILGPYLDLKSLQKEYNKLEKFNFENIEIIKKELNKDTPDTEDLMEIIDLY